MIHYKFNELNGELYAKRVQKLIYLHLFFGSSMTVDRSTMHAKTRGSNS